MSDTPEPMTDERLQEIELRADAATQGPWSLNVGPPEYDSMPPSSCIKSKIDTVAFCAMSRKWRTAFMKKDGPFIAHSRSDIPDLLAEVRRQRAEIAKLRSALEAITRRVPIMGSRGEYRDGQLHALEVCRAVAAKALEETK